MVYHVYPPAEVCLMTRVNWLKITKVPSLPFFLVQPNGNHTRWWHSCVILPSLRLLLQIWSLLATEYQDVFLPKCKVQVSLRQSTNQHSMSLMLRPLYLHSMVGVRATEAQPISVLCGVTGSYGYSSGVCASVSVVTMSSLLKP